MSRHYLEQGFAEQSDWREQIGRAIDDFSDWLAVSRLADSDSETRINNIRDSLRDDKLYVAVVAEFSRGKSELINAIFFSQLGQRVLPSTAGRTTMCPTELLYEPGEAPSIRLLPIETRATGTSIAEYKTRHDDWEYIPLDSSEPETLSDSLLSVTHIKRVSPEEASALGLPVATGESDMDGFKRREDGSVEIPRWRHAVVNFPHPLLEQGLVILDTPGLNALGTEPELTFGMLARAHAVLFVLAADAGVTRSDLDVWTEHISPATGPIRQGRMAILNKIDVLWDELKDASDVRAEIDRQVRSVSEDLDLSRDDIFPVSAQKALLARVRNDREMLEYSGIEVLERALAEQLIGARRDLCRGGVLADLHHLSDTIRAMLHQRLKDTNDHIAELEDLSGANTEVIEDIMDKVQKDKLTLNDNLQRFQASRAVFARQTHELHKHLNVARFERQIAETKKELNFRLTTPGMRHVMTLFMDKADEALRSADRQLDEIQGLVEGVYRQFAESMGGLNRPRNISFKNYRRELQNLRRRHDQHLRGLTLVVTEQQVLASQFHQTVATRVRQIFQRANAEAEKWLRAIMLPMETKVREHQIQLRRRLESIRRIHSARESVDDRIAEIRLVREDVLDNLSRLHHLTQEVEARLTGTHPGSRQEPDLRQSA